MVSTNQISTRKGFTLIELLVGMTIIAVLASIVIVAINPTKQLASARDAKRRSEINAILNAIGQYTLDNGTNMPCEPTDDGDGDTTQDCVDTTWRQLGGANEACDTAVDNCSGLTVAADCLRLRVLSGTYLPSVPADTRFGSGDAVANDTRSFYVVKAENNRVTVRACYTEEPANELIDATR